MATIIIYKSDTRIHVVCEGLVPNEPYNIGFYSDGKYSHKLCYRASDIFTPNDVSQARDMVGKMLRWKLGRYSEAINPRSR